MEAELALKADKMLVAASLDKKADDDLVVAALGNKADISLLSSALSTKADVGEVELLTVTFIITLLLSTILQVDSALQGKADVSFVTRQINVNRFVTPESEGELRGKQQEGI